MAEKLFATTFIIFKKTLRNHLSTDERVLSQPKKRKSVCFCFVRCSVRMPIKYESFDVRITIDGIE